MEKESKILEFKQDKTKTYLKTVSAFSNYGAGEIRFGVKDDGSILPIENPSQFGLDIENQINDSIKPQPYYRIVLNSNKTISLFVEKGVKPPYLYNNKAYKRNDTATIEVDDFEFKRLVLTGNNQTFDALESNRTDLTFSSLEELLSKKLLIKKADISILKTLGLYTEHGFNNAALLLSDQNTFNGLDIVVFGENINIFKERKDLSHCSLIKQLDMALEMFDRYYVEERVDGVYRNEVERIPLVAFREIIANAIIHRTYDIPANTKVEMWNDHITISSPGGLLSSIDEEQFKKGSFSVLRNPIIASVFSRLGIIDLFATGIRRTNESYFNFDVKPRYEVIGESVRVTLPVTNGKMMFSSEEDMHFLSLLDSNVFYTREKLEYLTGYNKTRLIRILNRLIAKGFIQRHGLGKKTYYSK